MNGPRHYRAAEQLVALAEQVRAEDGRAEEAFSDAVLAAAQVHATLALAAATAAAQATAYDGDDERSRGWAGVA